MRGFTLIELLVVIAIIAILSVIGITVFSGVQKNARDAKRKGDLHAISLALEQYHTNHGSYPVHCDAAWAYSMQSQPWLPELTSDLLQQQQPVDPLNTYGGNRYDTSVYQYQSKKIGTMANPAIGPCDTNYFVLGAHLENLGDSAINWNYEDYYGGWFVNYVVTNQQ